MKKRTMWSWMVITLTVMFLGALLLTSCASRVRVGALKTESQSVKLGDAKSVRAEIDFGAGDLQVTGGAKQLLEADFAYNVARLKPEVEYARGTLSVRQPESRGLPALRDITDFRNEWSLRLLEDVPMDLSVVIGAGTSDLQLAGLSLTRLNMDLGAAKSTVDLSGNWERDLDITIDTGAADVTVRLPRAVGVRADVEAGASWIEAPGMTQDGNVYTNAAYGVSDVTLKLGIKAGIGRIRLEVAE